MLEGVTVAISDYPPRSGEQSPCSSNAGTVYASCTYQGATATGLVNDGKGGYAAVQTSTTPKLALALDTYIFLLLGPSSSKVPVIISGTTNTKNGGEAYSIYQSGNPLVDQSFASSGPFTIRTSLTANNSFLVLISALAEGANSAASIDPMIAIDPSFALADRYKIVADPGIFAPTPEPVSAGTVGSVLGCLLIYLNHRKAVSVAQTR